MKRLPAALILLLGSSAAVAQEGWVRTETGFVGAERYVCEDGCAKDRVVCVTFSHPGSKGLQPTDLTKTDHLPWGQMDYAMVVATMSDRDDLDPGDMSGGDRLSGPELVSFSGLDWVTARYAFQSGAEAFSIELLLWTNMAEVEGLRCSYPAGRDVSQRVRDLAVDLRD
ncbi:hypothetical protein FPZ08_09875 [Devosia ginsengisoli]|uniref:Uncharacterized protein n=1 Tax=Devosia ginsengisoli TaxID=400770 RepID=A0A5B8LUL6_9HYPH|nr:hypothetical protein FPZ08_09875 [Devosia ginsengisoli]